MALEEVGLVLVRADAPVVLAQHREPHAVGHGWIARGLMRPLDPRLLLQHIWAMTQYHADYALQARVMMGVGAETAIDREQVARELIAFVLGGCGIKA